MAVDQPVPFEIVDGAQRVASNGSATLSLLDDVAAGARLFKRRAQKGLSLKPASELAIPLLNQLAGELLANGDVPAYVVAERVMAIARQVQPEPPKNIEWAVAEVDGVRVYFDGTNVVVTRQDINP